MTGFNLVDLIASPNSLGDQNLVDNICFNVDVRKRLYTVYTDTELKNPETTEAPTQQELHVVISYLLERAKKYDDIKALNTLFKICDGIIKNTETPNLPNAIHHRMNTILEGTTLPKPNTEHLDFVDVNKESSNIISKAKTANNYEIMKSKNINCIFVAWPGPVATAYLYTLKYNNIQPKEIIVVRTKKSYKRILLDLSPYFMSKFLELAFRKRITPNPYLPTVDIFENKAKSLTRSKLNYRHYCKRKKTITSKDINGISVIKTIKKLQEKHIIFTGGGIISSATLKKIGKRFLHMHPGKLPEVRGADGFFWSLLIKGYPSVSAIYQNEGIDTGEIITNVDFNMPSFDKRVLSNLGDDSYDIIYHSILNEYDPWMRALTLHKLICQCNGNMDNLSSSSLKIQQRTEGRNYHFMHKKIRNRVIDLMVEEQFSRSDRFTDQI